MKKLISVFTVFLCFIIILSSPLSVSATTFTVYNSSTVPDVTDGVKDDIWMTVGSSDVTFYRSGDNYPLNAKFYFLHDGITLFLALEYNDSTSSTSDADFIVFRFNMNYTNYMSSEHFDVLSLGYWSYFYGMDRYFNAIMGIEENDADIGGSLNITSGGSYANGKYFWEVSHPLDSGDSYDFSLTEDSSIEFIMGIYNDTQSIFESYSSNVVHVLNISSTILSENINFLLPIVGILSILVFRSKKKIIS